MAHVTAELVDENTLSVDGVLFHCKPDDEVLLRPVYSLSISASTLTPDLQCSNCGYKACYFSWYHRTGFVGRFVNHCPGCGLKIAGVIGGWQPAQSAQQTRSSSGSSN